MKTGGEPTRTMKDLLCDLLEQGRAAAPEVTGTHRFAHSRYYYIAWRTAFRSSGIVAGLIMFFFVFTTIQSSGSTTKDILFYALMVLLCLALPVMAYVSSTEFDQILKEMEEAGSVPRD